MFFKPLPLIVTLAAMSMPTSLFVKASSEANMDLCVNEGFNCANKSTCAYLDGGSDIDHNNDASSKEVYCRCTDDWAGLTCSTPQKQCGDSSLYCYNGGVCEKSSDTDTGFKCVCPKASSENNIFVGHSCAYEATTCEDISIQRILDKGAFCAEGDCVAPSG